MERIIVLRSAVLGDFIISSPALQLIREKNPDADITLLTIESAHQKDRNVAKAYTVEKRLPWLDFIADGVLDKSIVMHDMSFSYIFRKLRPIVKKIKPTKCYVLTDPLVGFKGNFAKYILLRLLGVKCKIYGWRDYVNGSKEKNNANENERCINHTLSCIESVLEDPSITDERIKIQFPIKVPQSGEMKADEIWKEYGFSNKKIAVISPGGVKEHKIWPVQGYINIIKKIIEETICDEVILTGTKKDIQIGEAIVNEVGSEHVYNLIAKTDLYSLAAIIKKSFMLIGNDGGSMHLGDAVGATVVAIMPGLELPRTVEPWHNINNSLRVKTSCSPCYNFDFCINHSHECMKSVTENMVMERIRHAHIEKKKYNSVTVRVDRSRKVPVLILDNYGDKGNHGRYY